MSGLLDALKSFAVGAVVVLFTLSVIFGAAVFIMTLVGRKIIGAEWVFVACLALFVCWLIYGAGLLIRGRNDV